MIHSLALKIYQVVPGKMRQRIGQSKLLKPIREVILRSKGTFREVSAFIKREYLDYLVEFRFFGSVKIVSQAKNRGIENTILRNSIRLFKKLEREDDAIILDIGSNFGYLSLVWARTISQKGKVFAFEPNTNVFNSIKKSISKNNLDLIIQPFNKAVGRKEGEINLYLKSTSSNTIRGGSETQKTTLIEMISIDHFTQLHNIPKCDIIKIDVDGIELEILKGSQGFINKCRPIIIVETNKDKGIIEFFNQNSYVILDMQLKEYKPGTELPPNVFCISKTEL